MTRPRRRGERGQATLWSVIVLAVLGAVAAALLGLGAEAVHRGRLQTVADLTALTAAHPELDPAVVAAANGASLVSVDHHPDLSVTVVVTDDGRRAVASASTAAPAEE